MFGRMVDRTYRELTDEEVVCIVCAYHVWRSSESAEEYADALGFCRSLTIDEVQKLACAHPLLLRGRTAAKR